ncbi:MAG TPA: carcinine hydrolase/isopenicillin-N N-acyltransferase family protein [Sphaerochaeta sp.]|nr:carcinine hydrolase/isopenicillin-N N-acyltransferase family protein [Sphaerochaeta sp.]HQB55139.1 carcinine hydrolase/isopenicillin-N N-acyltransferase family protein [Sphaerochaeta sp.]
MCDTIGRITDEQSVLFGKNSDRHPKEVQVLEFVTGSLESNRYPILDKYTPQFETLEKAHRHFEHPYLALISRPSWIWGAEMGVNDQGVVIGNEAVFTKQRSLKEGLLGMDILRLTLHNASTAEAAVELILTILDQWGQGGDGAFVGKLTYSNSFIIGDKTRLFVMETAGNRWAVKQIKTYGAISNAYSIGTSYERSDAVSSGKHFAETWRDGFMEFFSKGRARQRTTLNLLADAKPTWMGMRDVLLYNRGTIKKMDRSMKSIAINASFPKPTRTTASMVVEYPDETILVWSCPAPLPQYHPFVPIIFGADGIREGKDSYEATKKRQDLTNALLRSSAQERAKAAGAARALDKRFEKRIRTALSDKKKLKEAVLQCTADFHKHEEDLAKRLGV